MPYLHQQMRPLCDFPIWPRVLRGLMLLLLTAGMMYAAATSLLLASFTCGAGLAGLLFLAAGVWKARGSKPITTLLVTLLLWGITNLVLIRNSLAAYNREKTRYAAIIRQGGHLTLREKSTIYALNILMSITALPIYPEVARESLYLMIPCKSRQRCFEGDFFLSPALIRKKSATCKPEQREKSTGPAKTTCCIKTKPATRWRSIPAGSPLPPQETPCFTKCGYR